LADPLSNTPAIPLFTAECLYKETDFIPEGHLYEDQEPAFALPPLGKSTKEDFNPMVHLEIDLVVE